MSLTAVAEAANGTALPLPRLFLWPLPRSVSAARTTCSFYAHSRRVPETGCNASVSSETVVHKEILL